MRRKAITAAKAMSVRTATVAVCPEWTGCLGGEIAASGVVFVWGNSGNGKSNAVMSLARMLAAHGRVLYLSIEEGYSLSFQRTLGRNRMDALGAAFQIVDSAGIEDLQTLLRQKRSAKVVIIDSVQAMGLTWQQYFELRQRNPKTLFVLVSRAEGKQPEGRAARRMMYDAGLKIWVEGYVAFSKGRFIGETGIYTIWDKGARDYWGDTETISINHTQNNGNKH